MNAPEWFSRRLGPGGLESRALPSDAAPITSADATADQGPVIRGYGAVYGIVTTIGSDEYGFDEEFAQASFKQSLTTVDARCMFNHETDNLLGRTKPGTLRLAEDDKGLAYEVDVNPDDPNAMSTHAKVARGDVDGSSVWFRCIEDRWEYPDEANGLARPKRTIITAALVETGPVTFPAYEDAESCARSLRPLDAALRAAGMKSDHKRALFAADLLADPDSAEDQLRTLLTRSPELRDAVCSCDTRSGPAADPAHAERAAESAQEPDRQPKPTLATARARLELLRQPTPA